MTLACAAAHEGLSVAVIEKFNPENLKSSESDGRCSAIALGSKCFMERFGLWERIKDNAGSIWDIRVVDNNSPLFLHFDHADVGEEPMGYMVENHVTLKALFLLAETLPNLRLIAPSQYSIIDRVEAGVTIGLNDGTTIKSQLLVAADGRGSKIRELAGIKTNNVDYHQTGIVCNVRHEKHHQGIAIEHFMPSGPFAILPMHDGHHSSLVWTEKTQDAAKLVALSKQEILAEIQKRFGDFLGELSLDSKLFSYPLTLAWAKDFTAQRLALVGDAAHGIHPIAGQGYNLGIRGVEVLVDAITEYASLGLDIGSNQVLEKYKQARHYDVFSMIAITDGINRLFSNDVAPIRAARRIGLAAVDAVPGAKKFLMQHAMGMLK